MSPCRKGEHKVHPYTTLFFVGALRPCPLGAFYGQEACCAFENTSVLVKMPDISDFAVALKVNLRIGFKTLTQG